MRLTDKYVFFWASILGNWSKVKDGILVPAKYSLSGEESFRLPTSEHVFMYLKAKFFGDFEIAKQIMDTPDPKTVKHLGRNVRKFDESRWKEYREKAMWIALDLRWKSDERFRGYLMKPEFEGKKFVEANPYDKIWSCGYLENDPRTDLAESTWPGLNLLGKLLTKMRDERKEL